LDQQPPQQVAVVVEVMTHHQQIQVELLVVLVVVWHLIQDPLPDLQYPDKEMLEDQVLLVHLTMVLVVEVVLQVPDKMDLQLLQGTVDLEYKFLQFSKIQHQHQDQMVVVWDSLDHLVLIGLLVVEEVDISVLAEVKEKVVLDLLVVDLLLVLVMVESILQLQKGPVVRQILVLVEELEIGLLLHQYLKVNLAVPE
jgi:hypothetical protein